MKPRTYKLLKRYYIKLHSFMVFEYEYGNLMSVTPTGF